MNATNNAQLKQQAEARIAETQTAAADTDRRLAEVDAAKNAAAREFASLRDRARDLGANLRAASGRDAKDVIALELRGVTGDSLLPPASQPDLFKLCIDLNLYDPTIRQAWESWRGWTDSSPIGVAWHAHKAAAKEESDLRVRRDALASTVRALRAVVEALEQDRVTVNYYHHSQHLSWSVLTLAEARHEIFGRRWTNGFGARATLGTWELDMEGLDLLHKAIKNATAEPANA